MNLNWTRRRHYILAAADYGHIRRVPGPDRDRAEWVDSTVTSAIEAMRKARLVKLTPDRKWWVTTEKGTDLLAAWDTRYPKVGRHARTLVNARKELL